MEEVKERGGDDERAALKQEREEQEREARESGWGGYYDNRLRLDDVI